MMGPPSGLTKGTVDDAWEPAPITYLAESELRPRYPKPVHAA